MLKRPGLINVTVQDVRPDEHKGYVRVKVEPSARIPTAVYVHVNDHYEAESSAAPAAEGSSEEEAQAAAQGAASIIRILRERWEDSLAMAEKIEQAIIRRGDSSA